MKSGLIDVVELNTLLASGIDLQNILKFPSNFLGNIFCD
jgi:hypothetical protein